MLELILDSSLFEQWPQGSLRMNVHSMASMGYVFIVFLTVINQMKNIIVIKLLDPFSDPKENDPKASRW